MRILVTGGAGFIGSHVVDALIAGGHEILVLDNLQSTGGDRLIELPPLVQFVHMDIRDPALALVFKRFKPDLVSHHAAQNSVAVGTRRPMYDADVNVLGTLNVLEAAPDADVRKVVFASSAATYGEAERLPVDETTPQRPISPYGITKMIAERYLEYYRRQFGLEYTVLRYANVFGPRQDPSGECGVITIFAARFLRRQDVCIHGDGEQARAYVFVSDVAAANLATLNNGDGESYVIGSETMTSVNQIYHALVATTGYEAPITRAPRRRGDMHQISFDTSKASCQLGWMSRVSLLEGIRLTVDSLREQDGTDLDVAVA